VITWIAKAFKLGIAGTDAPFDGFKPGPTFSQPAREAVYVTRQRRPWFSVIGPGAPITRQPPGAAEPAYLLQNGQSVRQPYSVVGPGNFAGETVQQGLLMPPSSNAGSLSPSNVRNL
jgi:hypothetical protein